MLSYEHNYKNGELDGKQYDWHPNGELWVEENYINGMKDGKQYKWYGNGKKWEEQNWRNVEKMDCNIAGIEILEF